MFHIEEKMLFVAVFISFNLKTIQKLHLSRKWLPFCSGGTDTGIVLPHIESQDGHELLHRPLFTANFGG